MRVPFCRPDIGTREAQAAARTLRNGWLTTGPETAAFEREFARSVGAPHAVAVSSGTAALHLALVGAGVGPGDVVITSPNTFAATVQVIIHTGARPVLCDIDPATMNMSPEELERVVRSLRLAPHGSRPTSSGSRLTPNGSRPPRLVLLPVHVAGHPCDMTALMAIARRHHALVIEDAAHALGAEVRMSDVGRGTSLAESRRGSGNRPSSIVYRPIGSIGSATCFSFYATKNLTTGEGGMVTTPDAEFAQRLRILRLHGMSHDAWKRYAGHGSWRYDVERLGYKYNLPDPLAAIGRVQLRKMGRMSAARRRIAEAYTRAFAGLAELEVPQEMAYARHAWHLYVLRLNLERLTIGRDEFIRELARQGVGTSVHFIPIHYHSYFRTVLPYRRGDLPACEREFERTISLPLFSGMRRREVEHVSAAVRRVCAGSARAR